MRLLYKIWLDHRGRAFGDGPARLLDGVEEWGSLRKAATVGSSVRSASGSDMAQCPSSSGSAAAIEAFDVALKSYSLSTAASYGVTLYHPSTSTKYVYASCPAPGLPAPDVDAGPLSNRSAASVRCPHE